MFETIVSKRFSQDLTLKAAAMAGLLATCTALFLIVPSAAGAQSGARPEADAGEATASVTEAGRFFARRITGTWVEPGSGFSTVLNINADGTLMWWGSWFFGDGTGQFLDGPVFGTWTRTGLREISTVELGHLNNGDGSFYASGFVRQVFSFDKEFESFSYEGSEALFGPDQDPTDPKAVPFDAFTFSGGPFKRLERVEEAPAWASPVEHRRRIHRQ